MISSNFTGVFYLSLVAKNSLLSALPTSVPTFGVVTQKKQKREIKTVKNLINTSRLENHRKTDE